MNLHSFFVNTFYFAIKTWQSGFFKLLAVLVLTTSFPLHAEEGTARFAIIVGAEGSVRVDEDQNCGR